MVVGTNLSHSQRIELGDRCHDPKIKFICSESVGLFGFAFLYTNIHHLNATMNMKVILNGFNICIVSIHATVRYRHSFEQAPVPSLSVQGDGDIYPYPATTLQNRHQVDQSNN